MKIISHGFLSPHVRKKALSVIQRVKLPQEALVVEVGCGEGLLTIPAAQSIKARFVGVDRASFLYEEAWNEAQREAVDNFLVVSGDGEVLPFFNNTFHLTICVNTIADLGTVERVKKVVQEMYRITAQGGVAMVEFRNRRSPLYRLPFRRSFVPLTFKLSFSFNYTYRM
jgi:ubiquinone/menaquinone biosynthesis C-methylase UbiE